MNAVTQNLCFFLYRHTATKMQWPGLLADWAQCTLNRAFRLLSGASLTTAELASVAAKIHVDDAVCGPAADLRQQLIAQWIK